ncbi:MAG: hydrogenase formation protein HypD [Candidatus Cloacimonadota bacterium]|nr:MAG: hydrogenase formation protein HypD [Candidatus Cloacimonadota bacterium]
MQNQDFKHNSKLAQILAQLREQIKQKYSFMEVCGTHTVSILKNGFRDYFKNKIDFLSGPGCPVCVTAQRDIDKIVCLAKQNVIIATFGDMIKVPGTKSSLEKEQAKGADVKIIYNPLQCIDLARKYKDKKIVFIGIGFETTAPVIAALVQDAYQKNIRNLFILPLLKTIPQAINFLLQSPKVNINGFLLPGHVSVIIGENPYKFINSKYQLACAIAGFEPLDIALAIKSLLSQIKDGNPKIDNVYRRVVKKEGNPKAKVLIFKTFQKCDTYWRGLGIIPHSGLKLLDKYADFDADKNFSLEFEIEEKATGCICGDILAGIKSPLDCKLFGTKCTPDNPIGPCMVSIEGACSAFYKYGLTSINK